eukprot:CAMPEP_0176247718 /NCGR_PEP_ID=MMETSP0121_2-20121125/33098_1 /TAXON_ID=160619 /ORGANISM="Kryptoperidinium foliaceum, Strain CCMP 1326" /LENGTH=262 /DNA_ID=CAMNT_0017587379 /DNA_START=84 /DNA_END=872 /DNA_ORIENTATION=-
MARCVDCFFARGALEDLNNRQGQEGEATGDDEAVPEYHVTVDSFEQTRSRRAPSAPCVFFSMTVSQGNARWPLRRRFRQVAALHGQLVDGLGRSAMGQGLPRLPPRVTPRSLCCGRYDERFLSARAARLQQYFEDLLRFIPYVDQCEALREFLCSPDVRIDDYDALLDLGQAIGRAGGPQGVEASAIEALPRRSVEASLVSTGARCVICQDEMTSDEDVRVLPCAHEYHFKCIAEWISQNNSCCVCQGLAVLPCREAAESDK